MPGHACSNPSMPAPPPSPSSARASSAPERFGIAPRPCHAGSPTRPSPLATRPRRSQLRALRYRPRPRPRPAPSSCRPAPARKARSADSARCEGGSSMARAARGSPRRRPGTPPRGPPARPGAARRADPGPRSGAAVQPSRSRAATATTTAATVPSSPRPTRRAMLPRSSTKVRSGRRLASWARRRAEPVATSAAGGRSAQRQPDQGVAGVGPRSARPPARGRRA